jgi:hypothetical protein
LAPEKAIGDSPNATQPSSVPFGHARFSSGFVRTSSAHAYGARHTVRSICLCWSTMKREE